MASRKEQKERARQQRLAAERAAVARAAKARKLRLLGGVALAVAAAAVIAVVSASSGSSSGAPRPVLAARNLGPLSALGHLDPAGDPGPTGPEGVPTPTVPALAPPGAPSPGQTVDGIACGSEQTVFHVHTHLTIFVNGSARQIPYGIGIVPPRQVQQTPAGPFVAGGTCLTWLHTHAADGIIHIESPVQRGFTLGNFFDIWGQPLGPNQVGPAHGPVTAFYNGRHYIGNPRNIPIGDHVQIQLDVGRPLIAPEQVAFPSSL